MDRFAAMTAFVAVAERHSFTAAARHLQLSPSAVTRLVAALEAHLRAQLLRRTTRAVALTDAGEQYLQQTRPILAALREAEAAARAQHTTPSGRFVVAAPLVFGRLHVAPLLTAFLADHPAVQGELTLADRVVDLLAEGVDAAIRIGTLADSSLRVRAVGLTRQIVVASPRYLEAHRVRTIDDLRRLQHIHLTPLGGAPAWSFVRDGVAIPHPFTPTFVTNSVDAALDHARRDGGLVRVLAYQAESAIHRGELQIVLPRCEPPPLPIQLVHPAARLASATLRAFTAAIVAAPRWQFL